MEFIAIFKAVLALTFVLGLLLLSLWLIKYCQIKLQKNNLIRGLHKHSRLEVLETKRLDPKNSLLLIRRDNTEHLILVNPTQSAVIEANIKPAAKDKDHA